MKLDLTGQRFGKLVAIKEAGKLNGYVTWLCKCDCGNEKAMRTNALRSGATRSCGCGIDHARRNNPSFYQKEYRIHKLYQVWYGMINRCKNTHHKFYHRYGGRGITVCEEWKNYETFAKWALESGYKEGLSLDRRNNDGNYEPLNCRWITMKKQHNNTSQNRFYTINGVTKSVAEWAEDYGIRHGLVLHRLDRGISIEEALTMQSKYRGKGIPVRCIDTGETFQSSKAAADKYGVTTGAIARAARCGKMSCGMRWEQIYDEIPARSRYNKE